MKKAKRVISCLILAALLLCLTGCDSADYKKAVEMFESGEYESAIELFSKLGDYEDSEELLSQAKNEQLVFEACTNMRKMCKDPTSFMLYDDVYINETEYLYDNDYHNEGDPKTEVYISYGAKNEYGTMKTGFAVFDGSSYVGNWGDSERDFASTKDYLEFNTHLAMLNTAKKIGKAIGDSTDDLYSKFIIISGEKMAKLLGCDFAYITGIKDLD